MGRLLRQQKRGGGSPTYKSPSHRFKGMIRLPRTTGEGAVIDLVHCPGHSAPLAVMKVGDEITLVPAVRKVYVGQTISVGSSELGCVCTLKDIPEGTQICCVELRPEDGGKIIRSAGSSGYVVSKDEGSVVIRLPSGKLKKMNPLCRALIGTVAGGGIKDKPLMKAGKNFYRKNARNKYWPIVSGNKKDARDHPFGGGRHKHAGRPETVGHDTPPGRKVGSIAARRTGRKK
jgi:large subunit ribosomal protein L2